MAEENKFAGEILPEGVQRTEEGDLLLSAEAKWLDKMSSFVTWRIQTPIINNPFSNPLSASQVAQLASNKNAIIKQFVVRCLCDGYEVLQIKNPLSPQVITDHPCLTKFRKEEVKKHLEKAGIDKLIDQEAERIRAELAAQLDQKEQIAKEEYEKKTEQRAALTGEKEKGKAKIQPGKAGEAQFRIIKRR